MFVSLPGGSEVANTFENYEEHHFTGYVSAKGGHGTYLDHLIPPSTDDNGVLRVRAEPHARYPLSMSFLCDGVFAVTEGVPQLNRPIA